jgi:hypothetical protein
MREEHKLHVFREKMQKKVCESEKSEESERMYNETFCDLSLNLLSHIVVIMEFTVLQQDKHVAGMGRQ